MLENEQVRTELGAVGRNYAKEWSAAKQAQKMLTFYDSITRSLL
jgi:hypothetical protein